MELLGLTLGDGEREGDALELGEREGDGESEGDALEDGDADAEGESEGLTDADGDVVGVKARCAMLETPKSSIGVPRVKRRMPDETVTDTGTLFAGQSAAEKSEPSASANSSADVVIGSNESSGVSSSSSAKCVRRTNEALPRASEIS